MSSITNASFIPGEAPYSHQRYETNIRSEPPMGLKQKIAFYQDKHQYLSEKIKYNWREVEINDELSFTTHMISKLKDKYFMKNDEPYGENELDEEQVRKEWASQEFQRLKKSYSSNCSNIGGHIDAFNRDSSHPDNLAWMRYHLKNSQSGLSKEYDTMRSFFERNKKFLADDLPERFEIPVPVFSPPPPDSQPRNQSNKCCMIQ